MENNNLEDLKLEDDALEGVSGGKSPVKNGTDVLFCPKCNNKSLFHKWTGCSIKYNGVVYSDAVKFLCAKSHYKFFMLQDNMGNTVYTDEFGQLVNRNYSW